MNIQPSHYTNGSKSYSTAGHIVYSCQHHVIFCPKYRRPVLTPPIDARLRELFYEIADKYSFSIPDLEVIPDHNDIAQGATGFSRVGECAAVPVCFCLCYRDCVHFSENKANPEPVLQWFH